MAANCGQRGGVEAEGQKDRKTAKSHSCRVQDSQSKDYEYKGFRLMATMVPDWQAKASSWCSQVRPRPGLIANGQSVGPGTLCAV